jgi:hypothetical protein
VGAPKTAAAPAAAMAEAAGPALDATPLAAVVRRANREAAVHPAHPVHRGRRAHKTRREGTAVVGPREPVRSPAQVRTR